MVTPVPTPPPCFMFYETLGGRLYKGRRALEVVSEEEVEEYELTMLDVCAKLLGAPYGDIVSVYTDFGPDGPVSDAARRGLQTATRCFITCCLVSGFGFWVEAYCVFRLWGGGGGVQWRPGKRGSAIDCYYFTLLLGLRGRLVRLRGGPLRFSSDFLLFVIVTCSRVFVVY